MVLGTICRRSSMPHGGADVRNRGILLTSCIDELQRAMNCFGCFEGETHTHTHTRTPSLFVHIHKRTL